MRLLKKKIICAYFLCIFLFMCINSLKHILKNCTIRILFVIAFISQFMYGFEKKK